MNSYMKGIWFPVIFVTTFLAVYVLFASLRIENIAIAMFLVSPFLVIWMVYRVLKDGQPSGKTFSEHFYDDVDMKRIPDNDQ